MNTRRTLLAAAVAASVASVALSGCASLSGPAWTTLIDGAQGLDNWNRVGDANWRADTQAGVIVADQGKAGFLVSPKSYKNFEIYAEFYAEADTNSGIFIRAQDTKSVGADNSYEVNIWDIRPDPTYATGAIVGFANVPVPVVHKAGGRWNTMEIVANGSQLKVSMNGVVTSEAKDSKFADGPIALQSAGGIIKFRKLEIKPI
jgi:hypothetical protein